MKNRIARLLGYLKLGGANSWSNIEYFNKKWKIRIEKMSAHIDVNSSVVDLGCGPMWLRNYLPDNTRYYPVDYRDRGSDCIVMDFNERKYPDVDADTAFVSGCLEYVVDTDWFVAKICENQTKCILSYCTTEYFPDPAERQRKAWVNDLSESEVIKLFSKYGFELWQKTHEQTYVIFVFRENLPA